MLFGSFIFSVFWLHLRDGGANYRPGSKVERMSVSERRASAPSPCRIAEVIPVFNKRWLYPESMAVFHCRGADYSPESHRLQAFTVIHMPNTHHEHIMAITAPLGYFKNNVCTSLLLVITMFNII